jgi:NADPH:quinone reductase-like Zn-dependent oxidoreductase
MSASRTVYLNPPAGLNGLAIDTCEAPPPGPGEIRVRIHASSLNYHDYGVVTGRGRPPLAQRLIPMSDGAGVVTDAGAGVTEFRPGDRVLSTFSPTWHDGAARIAGFATVPGDGVDGFARTAVTLPATAFTHAPSGYSHAEAATLTCAGLTAWRALFVEGGLKPGDTVLVLSTGGVSIFALQFAKAAGATVVATSSSADKLARLGTLGVDHVVNYRDDPRWGETAARLTGGGVDHVVETGGAGTLEQSMAACRPGGHLAVIGIFSGVAAQLHVASILRKQLRLTGLLVGSRRDQTDMVRALEASGMRPVIDRHFPVDALGEAFRYQESNAHFGKICVDI